MFLFCRNIPLVRRNGSRVAYGDIFRIERHTFKVTFDPVETKVAFRIICGSDVKLRPRAVDGSDTIATDDAGAGSPNGQVSVDNFVPELNLSNARESDLIGNSGDGDANSAQLAVDDAAVDTDLENDPDNDEMDLVE